MAIFCNENRKFLTSLALLYAGSRFSDGNLKCKLFLISLAAHCQFFLIYLAANCKLFLIYISGCTLSTIPHFTGGTVNYFSFL